MGKNLWENPDVGKTYAKNVTILKELWAKLSKNV